MTYSQIKAIIVDDEPLARKGLSIRSQHIDGVEVVAECSSGREAIDAILAHKPDLVFLDIQMPGLNGFQVVQELKFQLNPLPHIVFVTAFDHFAIKAFEINALDYLLKPVDDERLAKCIDKVRHAISQSGQDENTQKLATILADVTGDDSDAILSRLANNDEVLANTYSDVMAIKDGSEISRVKVSDIIWVDAAGDYMCVNTTQSTHILRKTMKELEAELNPRLFVRIHRSIIVNRDYVSKLCTHVNGEYYVVLDNGKELKVSRSYRDKVKELVGMG